MRSNWLQLTLGVLVAALIALAIVWFVPATTAPRGTDDVAGAPVASAALPAATTVEASTAAVPEGPRFDTFRVEPDGTGLIAGRAAPGQSVTILLDGAAIAMAEADSSGAFVVFVTLDPSETPRRLRLQVEDGRALVTSAQTIIVAPFGITPEVAAPAGPVVAGAVTAAPLQSDAPAVIALANPLQTEPQPLVAPTPGPAPRLGPAPALDAAPEPAPAADDSDEPASLAETSPSSTAVPDLPAEQGAQTALTDAAESEDDATVAAVADEPVVALDGAADAMPEPQAAAASGDVAAAPEGAVDPAPPVSAPVEVPDAASVTDPAAMPEPLALADAAPQTAEPFAEDSAQQAEAAAILPDAVAAEVDLLAEAEMPDPGQITPDATPDAVAAEVPATASATVTAPAAESAPPVLIADDTGVRVLAGPEVLDAIALDTITYDPDGEVVLAGRAPGAGFVQVYIDNKPITSSRIAADGAWRTDLPEVDTGLYTLRIDQMGDDGSVLSRIETPFKREEAETVAAVMAEDTGVADFQIAMRTVQPGSTLWAIARETLGDGIMYVAVYEANRDLIRDPDLIYPGQVFRIPEAAQ